MAFIGDKSRNEGRGNSAALGYFIVHRQGTEKPAHYRRVQG